jgi:hypothetical protein
LNKRGLLLGSVNNELEERCGLGRALTLLGELLDLDLSWVQEATRETEGDMSVDDGSEADLDMMASDDVSHQREWWALLRAVPRGVAKALPLISPALCALGPYKLV